MIITIIHGIFQQTKRLWKVDGTLVAPTEDNIKKALDSAAKALYNEDVGSTFTMGGLHIEKAHKGFDVYVHVGQYT